jgi:hypothetical protein
MAQGRATQLVLVESTTRGAESFFFHGINSKLIGIIHIF